MVAASGNRYFVETLEIGQNPDGSVLAIPRYIAGEEKPKSTWVRPKPPWSWDDGWDELPIFVWHFLPDLSFSAHGGIELSSDYVFNRPSEMTFGLAAASLRERLTLAITYREGNKWTRMGAEELDVKHWEYWKAGRKVIIRYVNYLFHALG